MPLLRRSMIWLALIPLVIQTGCVSPRPVPTMEVRHRLGTVAIVPAQYIPRTNFDTFAKDKLSGAAKGAALGGGTSALVYAAAATNPYSMLVILFMTPVMIASGAVAGAVETMPAEKVQKIESLIEGTIAKLDAQRALAGRLTNAVEKENWIRLHAVGAIGPTESGRSPDYTTLQPLGVDSVLEVAVTEMGFQDSGCGGIPTGQKHYFCRDKTRNSLEFFMLARARLMRVSDGSELLASEVRYDSPWREAAQWMANDGQVLAAEVNAAYRDLADRITDEAFLITPVALPTYSIFLPWDDPLFGVCWLAPIYPKIERTGFFQAMFSMSDDCAAVMIARFGLVDSLHPRLQWSKFPRDIDRSQMDPALLRTIRDVTYDVKIWEVERCARGKLVYDRTGLSEPTQEVEEPLKPGQRYYWSFRARFSVNDQPMATRWAIFDPNGCYPSEILDSMYHRFVTPK